MCLYIKTNVYKITLRAEIKVNPLFLLNNIYLISDCQDFYHMILHHSL